MAISFHRLQEQPPFNHQRIGIHCAVLIYWVSRRNQAIQKKKKKFSNLIFSQEKVYLNAIKCWRVTGNRSFLLQFLLVWRFPLNQLGFSMFHYNYTYFKIINQDVPCLHIYIYIYTYIVAPEKIEKFFQELRSWKREGQQKWRKLGKNEHFLQSSSNALKKTIPRIHNEY